LSGEVFSRPPARRSLADTFRRTSLNVPSLPAFSFWKTHIIKTHIIKTHIILVYPDCPAGHRDSRGASELDFNAHSTDETPSLMVFSDRVNAGRTILTRRRKDARAPGLTKGKNEFCLSQLLASLRLRGFALNVPILSCDPMVDPGRAVGIKPREVNRMNSESNPMKMTEQIKNPSSRKTAAIHHVFSRIFINRKHYRSSHSSDWSALNQA